jgi:hypothetical protein
MFQEKLAIVDPIHILCQRHILNTGSDFVQNNVVGQYGAQFHIDGKFFHREKVTGCKCILRIGYIEIVEV